MKSNLSKEEIKNKLNALRKERTETELIELDSLILQANYLSEIERLTKERGINRKEIALKINTSPSYLTQVFRGDKPLNFITLAKIKRAVGLNFDVKAYFKEDTVKVIEFKKNSIKLLPITGGKNFEQNDKSYKLLA